MMLQSVIFPTLQSQRSEHAQRSPIACRTLSTAQSLASGLPRTSAISLDVTSLIDLNKAIQAHNLVVSLVPYIYHSAVIKLAIENKVNVVTTSYISPAIKELENAAKEAGIVILNEVGVDPGVDHLWAIKKIGEVHAKGGKVKEFYSYCGGLPALECANNPLGFKFSWSPRGAIMSQMNSASFILNGKKVDIAAKDLMASAKPYFVANGYDFVAYPNRDSVPFREFYKIPEADTVVRGSLRYEGNPAFIKAFADAGWLDANEKEWLKPGITWAQITQHVTDAVDPRESSLVASINEKCKFPNEAESNRITSGMRHFGLFSSEKANISGGNLLDTLCGQLEKLLTFQPGERDLVMLQHKFVVEWKDGKKETFTSTLELLGDPKGYSGMSKSVGVTCGIATQLLLDGHPALNIPGVLAPYEKEICDPIRELVEREGINMVEKTLRKIAQ
ncbi:MAG: hypothetical protein ASARMPREDX12_006128 [Alectoria sarmentosa]|nr:MAG: hypothetical protein ASARMPREDX12_006128 [Alectoria sarmentosa]